MLLWNCRYLVCVTITMGCEFPRYFELINSGTYTSRWAYSFHLLATIFYYLSLSLVVFSIAGRLLGLDKSGKLLKSLIISNAVFAVLVIVAVEQCVTADTLGEFFRTPFYTAFSICDATKNGIFGGVILFKAVWNLVNTKKFINSLDSSTSNHLRTPRDVESATWKQEQSRLRTARRLSRLIKLLIALNLCLLLRVITLGIKLYLLTAQDGKRSLGALLLYGQIWSIMDDLIPRGVPLLLFLFAQLKVTKRNSANSASGSIGSFSFSTSMFTALASTTTFKLSTSNNQKSNGEDAANGITMSPISKPPL